MAESSQSWTECIVCNVIADLNEGCEFYYLLSCTDWGAQIIVCVQANAESHVNASVCGLVA